MGHMERMTEERAPKKALKDIYKRKPVGRPRGRCIEVVDKNAKSMLKWNKWRSSAEDRDAWRRRIEEAAIQVGEGIKFLI
jgi:hypothetical protein